MNVPEDEAGRLVFEANRCRGLASAVQDKRAAGALRKIAELYIDEAVKLLNTADRDRSEV